MDSGIVSREVRMRVDGGDGIPGHLSYRFVHTDAGRSKSSRPKQKNDCTVRVVALVRGMSYDEAYDLLAAEGRKCGARFRLNDWIDSQPWARKISFPAIRGESRMNPAVFVKRHPVGLYVCKVAKHVFVIKDGLVYDDFENRPNRCIYTAFEITTESGLSNQK